MVNVVNETASWCMALSGGVHVVRSHLVARSVGGWSGGTYLHLARQGVA